MLKKISNWTFGSIFRTIGRFLAYFLIAMLIALLFTKKEYVKASTYQSQWIPNSGLSTNWGNSWVNKINDDAGYYTTQDSINTSESPSNYWFRFQDSNNNPVSYDLNGVEYLTFTVKLNIQNDQQITIDNNHVSCQYSYNQWQSTGEYYQNAALCTIDDSTLDMNNVQYGVDINYWFNNSPTQLKHCDIISMVGWNMNVQCPVSTDNISGIRITVSSNTSNYLHFNTGYYFTYTKKLSGTQQIIENQNQNHNETMNYFNSTISGEVNGTGENGTITDEDAESSSCGLLCKLKHLIKMLSIDNIKYIVVPTEEQMNDLFNQMQEKITSKIGILGLPVTVYTRLMQIAMQYQEGNQNWCLTWNAVQVPNFEEFNIIQAGNFCFSDILQNEKINTFRNTCHMIIGGLILLSFIQYLFNCLHRILDVPVQDNYEYFTTEDVYGIDTDTGEVQSHTIKSRRTTRRPV